MPHTCIRTCAAEEVRMLPAPGGCFSQDSSLCSTVANERQTAPSPCQLPIEVVLNRSSVGAIIMNHDGVRTGLLRIEVNLIGRLQTPQYMYFSSNHAVLAALGHGRLARTRGVPITLS
jgi:hypothetical protein